MLSKRKQEIVETLIQLISEKHSDNVYAEISKRLNMTPGNLSRYMTEIEQLGIIKRVVPFEVDFVKYHKELLTGGTRLEEAKRLKEMGLTYEQIGNVFGISRQRVEKILNK